MKKISGLLFFALFMTSIIHAQITKGSWLVGGNLISDYESVEERGDQFRLILSPEVGYSITDNIMLGGQLSFVSSFDENTFASTTRIRPFARYFLNPSSEGNIFFGEISADLELNADPTNIYTVGLGVNRFLNPSVALEGGLKYILVTNSFEDETSSGALLSLGVQAYLGRELMANRKSAQPTFGKGTLLLGTSSAVLSLDDQVFALGMTPNIGYFLSDQFVIGATLIGSFSTRTDDANVDAFRFGLNPFARYYLPLEGRCRYFAQLGGGFVQDRIDRDFGEFKTNSINFNAVIGTNVFVTTDLAIELGLGFTYESSELNNEIGEGTIDRYNVGLNIGFQYFWTR
jgi:hypothetical protein